mgnify:CR=1 FL=1
MRRKTISILLLLAISLSFLPATFAQGKVAVVCNMIDNEMNPGFVSSLRKANLTVDFFGVKDTGYAAYDYIIVLGGPDAEDRKINDIIYYLLNQNKLGVNPSFSSIGKELVMTRPTVRKNIKYLESKKYVIVHRNGRNKKVELTEKGKKLL